VDDVPLREYVERIFSERQAALDLAFAAQQEALRVANAAIENRLEKLNELRQEVTQDRGAYLTRTEYEAKHDALELAFQTANAAIDTRMKAMEGWRFRASGIFLVLVPLAGVIGAAIVRAFGG
jgi:hypothetical protein